MFPPQVEKWRAAIERRRASIAQLRILPTDMLLRWIQKESGGDFRVTTSLNERGLFQTGPDTASGMGLTAEEFRRLTTDGQWSFDVGIREVLQTMLRVERHLSNAGVVSPRTWPGYVPLVKLYHGLPLAVKEGTVGFAKANGRAPRDWEEVTKFLMMRAKASPSPFNLRPRGKDYSGGIPRYIKNAEFVAFGKAGPPGAGSAPESDSSRPLLVASTSTESVDALVDRAATLFSDEEVERRVNELVRQRPIDRSRLLERIEAVLRGDVS